MPRNSPSALAATPGEVRPEDASGSSLSTGAADADAPLVPPEDWKERLVKHAEEHGSLVAAARSVHIPLSRLHAERRADPAFHAACREVERCIDEAIIDKVRVAARDGEIRAQTLYFQRVRPLVVAAESGSDDGGLDLPPDVVAEMIRVGLAGVAERGPYDDGHPPTEPGQSRSPSRLQSQAPGTAKAEKEKADKVGAKAKTKAEKAKAKERARAKVKAEKAEAKARKTKMNGRKAEARARCDGEGPSATRGRKTISPRPSRREALHEAAPNAGFPPGLGAFLASPRLPDATSRIGEDQRRSWPPRGREAGGEAALRPAGWG